MDQKRGSVGGQQSMSNFPASPQEFRDAYPDRYGPADPPIDSRIEVSAITERCRKDVTPIRSTNEKLRQSGDTSSVRVRESPTDRSPGESVNNALVAILERHMLGKISGPLVVDPIVARGAATSSETISPSLPPSRILPIADASSPSAVHDPRSPAGSLGEGPASTVLSGGIPPACLDPAHDKLRALQEKLGCLPDGDGGADEVDGADDSQALQRLSKKRQRDTASDEAEEEEAAVDEGAWQQVKKV